MKINKLLLDTHIFLWWRANDPQLQGAARSAIAAADEGLSLRQLVGGLVNWYPSTFINIHNFNQIYPISC